MSIAHDDTELAVDVASYLPSDASPAVCAAIIEVMPEACFIPFGTTGGARSVLQVGAAQG